ncbi:MAG: SocA family protein [Alphaproteobacteria bacterium]|nr:SocA family protein [Alphaproteobacteria bacterium]
MTFTPKPDKIVDSILYLALKGLELDQYKTVKLLYLADRAHLRQFGRPITFDKYVAMPFGPVASAAYDLVRGKKALGINPSSLPFETSKHDKIFLVGNPKRDIDRDIFSRSDLMVLDDTADKYGAMSFVQLYKLTHDHFAYDRAWKNRKTKANDMRFEDFLAEDASKDDRISDLLFTSKGM